MSVHNPDQWVDWGDVTTTLDPVHHDQWIHDSHNGHYETRQRALAIEKNIVNNISHANKQKPVCAPNFVPASNMVTRRFPSWHEVGCYGRPEPSYMLPSISQLIYDNKLQNKSTDEIQQEMLSERHRISAQIHSRQNVVAQFKRTGQPTHHQFTEMSVVPEYATIYDAPNVFASIPDSNSKIYVG